MGYLSRIVRSSRFRLHLTIKTLSALSLSPPPLHLLLSSCSVQSTSAAFHGAETHLAVKWRTAAPTPRPRPRACSQRLMGMRGFSWTLLGACTINNIRYVFTCLLEDGSLEHNTKVKKKMLFAPNCKNHIKRKQRW